MSWIQTPEVIRLLAEIGIILRDVGRQGSRESQFVLGAAVTDDMLGVLHLALPDACSRSGDRSASTPGNGTGK